MSLYKYSIDLEVRFRDLDAFGHVNNAVYLTYFEVARMHYWKKLFSENPYTNLRFLVVRSECDYRSQAHLGDLLRVSVRIPELRNSSFIFDYQITEITTERLVGEGKTVQAFYDNETKKSKPIPPEVRKRIREFEEMTAD
jgi:acyl-CoA thioester hydrolase